jgi:hypothetical protein
VVGSCPECGGRQRREIAPGFFQCTSRRLTDVIPAGSFGNPTTVPVDSECGHRYQEAPASPAVQCACGMFAVAACVQCGEPLCGDHVVHRNDQVLCAEHARRDAERIAAERRIERERAEQAKIDVLMTQVEDPIERRIRAITQLKLDEPLRTEVAPVTWDDDELLSWFRHRAPEPPPYIVTIHRKFLVFEREIRHRCWTFSGRDSKTVTDGWGVQSEHPRPLHVLADGTLYVPEPDSWPSYPRRELGDGALAGMVEYVGLATIEGLPEPDRWAR